MRCLNVLPKVFDDSAIALVVPAQSVDVVGSRATSMALPRPPDRRSPPIVGWWRLRQGFAPPDHIALDTQRRRQTATAVTVEVRLVLTKARVDIESTCPGLGFREACSTSSAHPNARVRRTSSCRGSLRTRLPGRCLVAASPEVHSLCSGLFRSAYDLDDTSASIHNMEVQTNGKQDTG